jgi:hypothetical protein
MKWHQGAMLIATACSGLSASAQLTRDVAEQNHTWFMAFGNHRLSDALGLHTEYQFRRTGFGQDWQQSLMRVGLDWHRRKLTGIVSVFCGPQFAMLAASLDLLRCKRVHGMTKEDEQTANSETRIRAGAPRQCAPI